MPGGGGRPVDSEAVHGATESSGNWGEMIEPINLGSPKKFLPRMKILHTKVMWKKFTGNKVISGEFRHGDEVLR